MKRVAHAREKPVVVPIVVVAVDIHVPLVVVPVTEGGRLLYDASSVPLSIE
jgi:hypothetical protein